MNFSLSAEIDAIRLKTKTFVAKEVLPLEGDRGNYDPHENINTDVLSTIRNKAKESGLWAPQRANAAARVRRSLRSLP